ncbi:MAG: hypothetical protein K8R25_18505 [Methanosarcinales archaeon]|nr:hypothetical protein [Methanosarcinales archaeon]
MLIPKQAENLREAYNIFDHTTPLQGAWFDTFYIERPTLDVLKLRLDLQDDERETSKRLFTGHRGSGKSTELIRLANELSSQYFTVYFTIEETLDLADLDYKDVLLSLGSELYKAAKARKLKLPSSLLSDLVGWFSTTLREVEKDIAADAELETKADFFFIKLLSRLKSEVHTRNIVRRQIESNLSDLLKCINAIIEEIRKQQDNRQILVIIDGLDKVYDLDIAMKMYYSGGINLLLPKCKIIYTVPLALFYTSQFGQVRATFDDFFVLPNIKIRHRDGTPEEVGLDALTRLVNVRIKPELITSDALKELTELSGGLIRDLIYLAKDASSNARVRQGERIEQSDVNRAANKIRNVYRTMLKPEEYEELRYICNNPSKQPFSNAIAQKLVHNLSLIEYRNEGTWWDVHPIVVPLLSKHDTISTNTSGSAT